MKISETLYMGIWALFLFFVAIAALATIYRFDMLPFLVENFQSDSYDTILSVRFFHDYGPFGNVPYYSGPYTLFGNFPLLFAFFGSIVDYLLNDPSLSASILYWIVDIAMAAVLWSRYFKNSDWKMKLLFIVFFTVNFVFANAFPFGYRKRQALAILIGLLLFLVEKIPLQFLLAFLTLLAQPFIGAWIIILRISISLERKQYREIPLFLLPFIIAFPFYSNLFTFSSMEPLMSGCGYVEKPLLSFWIFFSIFLVFFIHNRKKMGFLEIATAAILLFFPGQWLFFQIFRNALPLAIMEKFLYLSSLPCPHSLLNVAALGMVLSIFIKKMDFPKLAIILLLIFNISNLMYVSAHLVQESSFFYDFKNFTDDIQDLGISRIKGMQMWAAEYSKSIQIKPLFTLYALQGYSILHDYNITFVDEFNMPPQLSKGKTNIPMAQLPEAIYHADLEKCRANVGELREADVQGLFFLVTYGNNNNAPESFELRRFFDRDFLKKCGLRPALDDPSKGIFANESQLVFYKID